MKLLIIGERPGKYNDGKRAFSGKSGERLAEFLGMTKQEFLDHVDTVNLFNDVSNHWNAQAAVKRAKEINVKDRIVLLMGYKVADAFEVKGSYFELVNIPNAFEAYIFPHSSGANRFWNSPSNTEMAKRFFREKFIDASTLE
jgi:uracil-DNA glycosylase